jgi:formimidoylglutamate deiminase
MSDDVKLSSLWTPFAWVGTGRDAAWAKNVLLEIDGRGYWSGITSGVAKAAATKAGALCISQPLIPSVINAHSHAFQRAFAGLAERRESVHDDFWSWRDRMYRVALAISPAQLKAVASHLYLELLRGGYTQVCEFHYVHHATNGLQFDEPLIMSWMLMEAAAEVGIGLTLLPVLYERAGFVQPTLRNDQRRFATHARWIIDAQKRIDNASQGTLCNSGVAIHSLRAVAPEGLNDLLSGASGPIHIHVAEQTGEVDDCLKHTGLRPVQWLLKHHALDTRWNLVHATHVNVAEIESVARSGASVVLCPTTEANLGDGVTDLRAWFNADASIAIGSDSHVTRDWREELRLLEYGQRLHMRERNVAAAPEKSIVSTAQHLFNHAVAGGAAAAGFASWGLVVGARADALVLDDTDSALIGILPSRLMDAAIFSSPSRVFSDVLIAGRWHVRAGGHARQSAITESFASAMDEMWVAGPSAE